MPVENTHKVIFLPESAEFLPRAEKIAIKFGGAICSNMNQIDLAGDIIIFIGSKGISMKISGNTQEKPVFIDFASGKMQHRKNNSGTRKEAIARAVGLKSGTNLSILDTTAGLGGDSFVLASLGANMTMLERNPFVYLLLEDALARAHIDAKLEPIIQRMNLIPEDSIKYLDDISIKPDVIYMDPMFPSKTKTAQSKKEMRLFRVIAGKDEDAEMLFTKALLVAQKRVVVKRPIKSSYVLDKKPEFSVEGSSSRFDVYMTHGQTI